MMEKTMRAQLFEDIDKINYCEIPIPQISDTEVLIKVKACGICGTDWSIYKGNYAYDFLPFISGHETFGVVAEKGDKVNNVEIGDRVAIDLCMACGTCYYCRRGDELLCENFTCLGVHTDGGFAEYVKAPGKNCYIVPDCLSDYQGAFVEPLAAVTHASKRLNAKIASSLVVIGDGLGSLHAAVGKIRGAAPIIVIGQNERRLDIAKKMGADFTLNTFECDDCLEAVFDITKGIGADYVIEAVGTTETYELAFSMLRRGGTLEAFGICRDDAYARLKPYEFVLGEKKVSGSCAGIGVNFAEAINLLEYGRIVPDKMFSMAIPLEELESALHEIQENKDIMKVFVCPELNERIIFD